MKKALSTPIIISILLILLIAGLQFANSAKADQFYVTQSPPSIIIKNPSYAVYGLVVPLEFTINYYETEPSNLIWGHHIEWLGYSIDNGPYVTIQPSTSSGSSDSRWDTLTTGSASVDLLLDASGLSNGLHTVTIKADFMFLVEQSNAGHYYYTFSPISFIVNKSSLIHILSPNNDSIYNSSDIPLSFTINKQVVGLSWIGCSMDNQPNITISGNTTLTELVDGFHSLIVYANDTAGNMDASQTIDFTVTSNEKPQTPEPFPTLLVFAASVAVAAVVALGLLVYLKKRKR